MEITVLDIVDLLQKYIDHVMLNEGIDFLSDEKIKQSEIKFADWEIEMLKNLRNV